MRSVNLHLLTRVHDHETISLLLQALSGSGVYKAVSPHEAASLWTLADLLSSQFLCSCGGSDENWISYLDGFFISYVIDHIGKEFDLLKISSDGECVLNIELKSEDIGEERIRKQLEQNRYYLSHTARTIFSFTYVMDTGCLYSMNDRGYLRQCPPEDLIRVLKRPALSDYLREGIGRFFRASDYLISPVAAPEKFLLGQYFLTNQQFDFRRKILEHLETERLPVVSVSGIAGTGKTLLLFDLAMQLSRKNRVLLIHSGTLRQGHILISERLRNVDIRSGEAGITGNGLEGYACLMIDEADHLRPFALKAFLKQAAGYGIPVILAYDPHHLLSEQDPHTAETETAADTGTEEASGAPETAETAETPGTPEPDKTAEAPETEKAAETAKAAAAATVDLICDSSTLSLAFTGNIRINRPVYSFLRTLLHLKDRSGCPDYSCIDVLYAEDTGELDLISGYYAGMGYDLIGSSGRSRKENTVIAQEYEKVLMVLSEEHYYDESLHLQVKSSAGTSLRLLYEGLSRTRESLCLVIVGNKKLFSYILGIRLHHKSPELP